MNILFDLAEYYDLIVKSCQLQEIDGIEDNQN